MNIATYTTVGMTVEIENFKLFNEVADFLVREMGVDYSFLLTVDKEEFNEYTSPDYIAGLSEEARNIINGIRNHKEYPTAHFIELTDA